MNFTYKLKGLKFYKPKDRALPKDMYHLKKGNLTFLALVPPPPSSWYCLIACHNRLVRHVGDWGKVCHCHPLTPKAKKEVLARVGDWQAVNKLIKAWSRTFND